MAQSQENNLFREVAKKSDIVEVIGFYLGSSALKKSGKKYLCLCPFHNDSHPSMQVDPQRNTFHCYVCDTYGDSITFVEKFAHLPPIEALRKVADICQIPIPKTYEKRKESDPLFERFPKELKALEELSNFYRLSLQARDGKLARDYLSSRGMDAKTIEHFGIGFAPFDPRKSVAALRGLGFDVPTLERAGILAPSADIKDRQDGRIIFPITDHRGHVVGFSGRKFLPDQEGGKYVNSPETELFHKGRILYHLDHARESARKDGYVYVVEGYMDCIAFQRAGIDSVVALMGAALTSEQADALKELNVECRLFLDSDEPGQMGEERSLPLLHERKIPTRIGWKLTGGKDADEILTKLGPEELLRQAQRLYDVPMFLLGRRLKGRKILAESQEIERYLSEIRPYFQDLGAISRAKDVRQIARRTSLTEEEILPLLQVEDKKEEVAPKKTSSSTMESARRPSFPPRPTRNEPIRNVTLAPKYTGTDVFHRLFLFLRDLHSGEGMAGSLVKNELIIVLTLPRSREAYADFLRSHVVFCQKELNVLADLIGNVYLSDESLVAFGATEYERLLGSLQQESAAQKTEPEEEDDFDLDDGQDEALSMTNDVRVALVQIVQESRLLESPGYDPQSFRNYLQNEQNLLRIRRFEEEVHQERAEGEVLSVDVVSQSFQTYRKKNSR